MTDKMSQFTKLMDYLYHHDGITQAEAAEQLGIWRLSARIWDIRHYGITVTSTVEKGKNRDGVPCKWVRYRFPEETKAQFLEVENQWRAEHGK